MALETFRSKLKAKAKTLGVTNLQNKRIDAFAATLEKQHPNLATDDDHDPVIDAFLELVDIKEIAAFDDYKLSKGKKDGKTDDKKDDGTKDTTDAGKKTDEVDDPNEPTWAKNLRKQNEALAGQLAKLQAKETKETMQARLKKDLDGVPEWFYKNWPTPEKDEDYEAFTDKVKAEWEPVSKNYTEPAQGGAGSQQQQQRRTHQPQRSSGGGKSDEASKEEIDDIVKIIT